VTKDKDKIRVAINGFGRIGRVFFRTAWNDPRLDIVAINDITSTDVLAHLLKYDSVHGRFAAKVTHDEKALHVDGRTFPVYTERAPEKLPWKSLAVDCAVESTGLFTDREGASRHLAAGAGRVLISAPAKEPDVTVVLGVNEKAFDPKSHRIVSNASCTTNCLAPVAKVLLDTFGIVQGFMTTVHAYTNDQRVHDLPHKDLRRCRAAAENMIPTSTGAAKAIGEVIPELKGRLDGIAIRVPVKDVSVVDLVVQTEKPATIESVNKAMREAAAGRMKGYLAYQEDPIVSGDVLGDAHSSVLDAPSTMVMGDRFVKVLSWYDNEWAYATRVRDLVAYMYHR
jgi:glyceraldehyde 3-phosphate dehydrogenase